MSSAHNVPVTITHMSDSAWDVAPRNASVLASKIAAVRAYCQQWGAVQDTTSGAEDYHEFIVTTSHRIDTRCVASDLGVACEPAGEDGYRVYFRAR